MIVGALRRAPGSLSTAEIVAVALTRLLGTGKARAPPWRRVCEATSPIWSGARKWPRRGTDISPRCASPEDA